MKKLSNMRILGKDVYVSNDCRKTGLNNNDMVIGSASSGKTGTYVVPNICCISGSMVVSDTKGLLWRRFSEPLKKRGYKVAVIDFVNPENSAGYNPLAYIRRNSDGSWRETDIKRVATTLVPPLDRREPFWEKAAIRYIAMLISYVMDALPEEERNMLSVFRIVSLPKNDRETLLTEWAFRHPNTLTATSYNRMSATTSADRMWSSIMEFVNEALDPFGYREMKSIFGAKESFDIESLGREKTVLFLNTSDNDTTFHVLCDVFHTQAMNRLLDYADSMEDGRLPVPVRFILDDFGAASRIPGFENTISIIRSREISVSVILQSLSQLQERYGKSNAETILNNTDHVLYYGGLDLETATFFANHLNKPVNTVMKLRRDEAVLLTGGEDARVIRKLPPYSMQMEEEDESEEEM